MDPLVDGTMADVVEDAAGLYGGNLDHYFEVVFSGPNVMNPYHNFRHMNHVPWLCYEACMFYAHRPEGLSPREIRNTLIAGFFHDYGHFGQMGDDDLNITRALRGLNRHILPEDRPFQGDINRLIEPTEYPYRADINANTLPLGALILRDADMCQAFSPAWIQQVVYGLSAEWRISPFEVLLVQEKFLSNLVFHTEWAKQKYPRSVIDRKILEAARYIQIIKRARAAREKS
jgi:hypothetical protein